MAQVASRTTSNAAARCSTKRPRARREVAERSPRPGDSRAEMAQASAGALSHSLRNTRETSASRAERPAQGEYLTAVTGSLAEVASGVHVAHREPAWPCHVSVQSGFGMLDRSRKSGTMAPVAGRCGLRWPSCAKRLVTCRFIQFQTKHVFAAAGTVRCAGRAVTFGLAGHAVCTREPVDGRVRAPDLPARLSLLVSRSTDGVTRVAPEGRPASELGAR